MKNRSFFLSFFFCCSILLCLYAFKLIVLCFLFRFRLQMPYLNPARSLGPSFVLNRWDNHWVYWLGPMVGGALAAIIYRYVFNPQRALKLNRDIESDSASVSDDDTNFDLDLDKGNPMQQAKFHGSSYRSPNGTMQQQNGYNVYTSEAGGKSEQMEPIYGGTRSMYCKSPPLTRANLNRSQSVYAKSNSAINREFMPRAGPLVPAQSLYPLRMSTHGQSSHLQNQNVQNQMQQRSESIYGIRSSMRQEPRTMPPSSAGHSGENGATGFQSVYGTRANPSQDLVKFERETARDEGKMFSNRQCRPDSMYGSSQRRGQSTQSDDSSYGSYHGSNPQTSSTPLSQQSNREPMMSTNYGPTPSASQSMRPQNGPMDRKTSMSGVGGGMEPRTFGQNPMQMQSKGMMSVNGGASSSSNGPITHQYNMQQMRQ